MRRTAWLLAGALLLGASEEPEVRIFFSPDSPDASRLFAEARALGVTPRPVLLVERFVGAREPGAAFVATLQACGEVRVVDPEGLHEAERLKIRELPAVAVRRGRRTHVACGAGVDVKEMLRCSR